MMRYLWSNLEEILVGVILGILVIGVLIGIFARYVLGAPFMVMDELARYLLIWLTFLGAAAALKKDEHIRIELINQYLTPKIRRCQGIGISVIVILMVMVMFFYGISLAEKSYIIRSASLEIRQTYLYIIIPISALLMLLRIREWLPKMIRRK